MPPSVRGGNAARGPFCGFTLGRWWRCGHGSWGLALAGPLLGCPICRIGGVTPRTGSVPPTRPVGVGSVLDGKDVDAVLSGVDAVDHPVVAAAGAVQPGHLEPQ